MPTPAQMNTRIDRDLKQSGDAAFCDVWRAAAHAHAGRGDHPQPGACSSWRV